MKCVIFGINNLFIICRSDPNVLEPDTFNISSCSGFENKLSECVWSRSDVSLSCMSGVVNLECCK